jgi:hypothetical protein
MMNGHMLRVGALSALMVGLAACSSGTAQAPRTAAPASQSGTMDHSNMGQMDHAQMMEHCRAMMHGEGMAQGGSTAGSGGMGQRDHAQMMQHCQAMMAQPNQGGAPATR